MLSVFMKFLAQLQTWEPLVLLQSWEQVPKRRHSLMSGQQEMGSGGDPEGAPRTPTLPQGHRSCRPNPTPAVKSHLTNAKPHRQIPSPLQQQREVPWQKFLSGTFWKPLRQVQYEVDWDWTQWASSPHMVVLVMQS